MTDRTDSLSTEIERRFIVRTLPDGLRKYERQDIEQGYLAFGSTRAHARLRRAGTQRLLTVKQGQGLERTEVEIALDDDQFDALWPLTDGQRITKTRYRIPHGGHVIELDVFRSVVEGLAIAEVEFASRDEAESFEPPNWFGSEVTADPRYGNYALARRG